MRDVVGIELKLQQNLESQLKAILPMLTKMDGMFSKINKTMLMMENQQKRVNQQFDSMGRSIDSVTRKERGLASVNKQVSNVGAAARTATRSVETLGGALGTLTKLVAPLMLLQKMIQGTEFLGGSAINYEKTVKRIRMSRFSPAEQQEVIDKSKQYGASGNYALSADQFGDYALRARAIMGTGREAIDSMSLMGKVDMAMRKIGVEGSDNGNTGFAMAQIFEKLGDRTPVQQKETADLLAQFENYYAGQIPLQTFSTQLQRTRGAKLGADKRAMFGQLFHGISEQMGSSGGSGAGGAGSVGTGYLAFDAMVSGNMSKQMIDVWKEAGMFPGIEHYAKHKKRGKGHSDLIDIISGKHVVYKGGKTLTGAGSDIYNKDVLQDYLSHSAPAWYNQAASDQRGFMQGPMIAGMERFFHLKPGTFHQQSDQDQKRMIRRFLPGAKNTAQGQAIENIAGRYAQTVEQQQEGSKTSKNLDETLDTATSVKDNFSKLFASFETFGNALGDNKKLIGDANMAINGLTQVIGALNNNVGPIANFLSKFITGPMGHFLSDPQQTPAEFIKNKTGGMIDFTNVDKHPTNASPIPHGTAAGSHSNAGLSVPPPPIIPTIDPYTGRPLASGQSLRPGIPGGPPLTGAIVKHTGSVHSVATIPASGAAHTRQTVDWLKSMSAPVLNFTFNHETKIGDKTIHKEVVKTMGKAMTKSGVKSSYAGSPPSGSYGVNTLDSGGGP